MKQKFLLFLICLILIIAALASFFIIKKGKYDFVAKSVNGNFVLSKIQKPVILYFGYTYCPDICPTTLFLVSNALDELKLDAQIIFISVDLQRDDLQSCDLYAKHFRKDAICARLEKEELDKVMQIYDSQYKIENINGSISVAHTPYVYLLQNAKLISKVTNLASKNLKKELKKLQ